MHGDRFEAVDKADSRCLERNKQTVGTMTKKVEATKRLILIATLGLGTSSLVSCGNSGYSTTERRATQGAVGGAVIGGVVGHQSGNALEGAAIGAGVGGLAGAASAR